MKLLLLVMVVVVRGRRAHFLLDFHGNIQIHVLLTPQGKTQLGSKSATDEKLADIKTTQRVREKKINRAGGMRLSSGQLGRWALGRMQMSCFSIIIRLAQNRLQAQ